MNLIVWKSAHWLSGEENVTMRSARVTSPEALGRILRESRLSHGLTQDEVAEHMDVNRRYVIELEGGKPTLALKRLFKYMRATGVVMYTEITDAAQAQS
jgi:transcriptional regulator with XRE-family HTH domain